MESNPMKIPLANMFQIYHVVYKKFDRLNGSIEGIHHYDAFSILT